MSVIVVTGSGGLIGSAAVAHFVGIADTVVGIDNDLRAEFFGAEASTRSVASSLRDRYSNYRHHDLDIRDAQGIKALFAALGSDISLVVHTAAQPSHDWAATDPHTDFMVNAAGTLNLLEATRASSPEAVFIFTSTNKVYGDLPNHLPLVEGEERFELDEDHRWHAHGIPEEMSIDQSTHSLFGVSKASADLMVQEYGRYFGLKTAVFRGGCLTGPDHAGAELHGFLAYLVKCVVEGRRYTVFGHKAKQVRDNIHATDLIAAFDEVYRAPRHGGPVYNIGGGRRVNCSMREAIRITEELAGTSLDWSYTDDARIGDHRWYVSDTRRFEAHYPQWNLRYSLLDILEEIVEAESERGR